MNHVLSLEVPETLNICQLRIQDTSIYNPDKAPVCQLLEVTLPGFNVPVQFDATKISPGFSLNLTGCDLGIQTENCGTSYCDLSDGIYIIKYSVSPNDIVYVEYNHLRITNALNTIQCVLCDLDLGACDPPQSIKEKLEQITLIRRYLDAAKAKVEYCHEPDAGMSLYNYSLKLLDKLTCHTNCNKNHCSTC